MSLHGSSDYGGTIGSKWGTLCSLVIVGLQCGQIIGANPVPEIISEQADSCTCVMKKYNRNLIYDSF